MKSYSDTATMAQIERNIVGIPQGLTWFAAPFEANNDGRHHRCKDGALPRRFLGFDLDGGTRQGFVDLGMYLAEFRGFGYTTASHTTGNPHSRHVLELSRPVDRAEGLRLGQALQRLIEAHVGSRAIRLDPSAYRAEQPLFAPLVGAEVMRYDGEPVDVDEVLKGAPPLKESPGRTERAAAISSRDPVVQVLADRKRVKREHGDGKLSVACPFEHEHTEAGGESSTVYFLPNFGGVPYGKFVCLHTHCAQRKQEDFLTALDLDPHKVWREQRGGAVPSDDLPPLDAYAGDAAQERAPSPGNGAAPGAFHCGEAVYRCVSGIEPKPIRWLWPGRIARGKVFMLAGHPGLGKSQAMLSMASIVTTGGTWPVDRTACDAGKVIILSAEDDAEDTIRPRMQAAGADLDRVYLLDAIRETNRDGASIKRPFNLTEDIDRLRDLVRKLGDVVLIVIDPATAYLGHVDSHRNAEVRAVLAPLAEMAAEVGAAVVCVSHLTKAGGTEAMMRVMGSLGFVAAARGAYLVAKDPEDDTRRLFLPIKNNLAEDRSGLAFRVKGRDLDGGIVTSCVEWDSDPVTMTADEALVPAGDPEERSELEDAKEFLRGLLKHGPVASKRVRATAREEEHAWPTIRRAKKALGIEASKEGMKGPWVWKFPPKVIKNSEDAHTNMVSAFGQDDHLREPSKDDPDPEASVETVALCPRCAGEGCRWCMGRQPQEPR